MIEIYYELKVDGPGQYQLNPLAGWIRRAAVAAAASWGFVLPWGQKIRPFRATATEKKYSEALASDSFDLVPLKSPK